LRIAPCEQHSGGPLAIDLDLAQVGFSRHLGKFGGRKRGTNAANGVGVDNGRAAENSAGGVGECKTVTVAAKVAYEDRAARGGGHAAEEFDGAVARQMVKEQRTHHDVVLTGQFVLERIEASKPDRCGETTGTLLGKFNCSRANIDAGDFEFHPESLGSLPKGEGDVARTGGNVEDPHGPWSERCGYLGDWRPKDSGARADAVQSCQSGEGAVELLGWQRGVVHFLRCEAAVSKKRHWLQPEGKQNGKLPGGLRVLLATSI
jgi:hypothetical protein